MRNWFCSSSPTERMRRLPRWSMSSTVPMPIRQAVHIVDGSENIVDDDMLRDQLVRPGYDRFLERFLVLSALVQDLRQDAETDASR